MECDRNGTLGWWKLLASGGGKAYSEDVLVEQPNSPSVGNRRTDSGAGGGLFILNLTHDQEMFLYEAN